jgi:hypothetical protein
VEDTIPDFANELWNALSEARRHAELVRDTPEEKHRAICHQFEERVAATFAAAHSLTEGYLRFVQRRGANHTTKLYGLAIKRDRFATVVLFVRVDATNAQTWWQLYEGTNIDYALGGWWNVPVLIIPDFDDWIKAKVLELVRTLREDDATGPVVHHGGS